MTNGEINGFLRKKSTTTKSGRASIINEIKAIQKELKSWRESKDLTQADLGKLLQVHWTAIHRWEKGKSLIKNPYILERLKELMGKK